MAAAKAVGDLVGGILPHFADDDGVGLFRPGGGVDGMDHKVGQFVGHIQPPAVRPCPEPGADDAVFPGDVP